jgi:hypothetical protein
VGGIFGGGEDGQKVVNPNLVAPVPAIRKRT